MFMKAYMMCHDVFMEAICHLYDLINLPDKRLKKGHANEKGS